MRRAGWVVTEKEKLVVTELGEQVQAGANGRVSFVQNFLSYGAPQIFRLEGCSRTNPPSPFAVQNCTRTGGDSIMITGRNFGIAFIAESTLLSYYIIFVFTLGARSAAVLVGTAECTK